MMYLYVFIVSYFVNIFYAVYIIELGNNKLLKAALFGELLVLAGAFNIINYTQNKWYLIPVVLGGFLGTISTKLWRKSPPSEK